MTDKEPTGPESTGPKSTGGESTDRRSTAADAELADAMDSIQSIGEDWRSSDRGTESDRDDDEKGRTDG